MINFVLHNNLFYQHIVGKLWKTTTVASRLANLTFNLLANCQEKEEHLAHLHELNSSRIQNLEIVWFPESINNKTIAERMKLSPSRLTRITDGLVGKEYIAKAN